MLWKCWWFYAHGFLVGHHSSCLCGIEAVILNISEAKCDPCSVTLPQEIQFASIQSPLDTFTLCPHFCSFSWQIGFAYLFLNYYIILYNISTYPCQRNLGMFNNWNRLCILRLCLFTQSHWGQSMRGDFQHPSLCLQLCIILILVLTVLLFFALHCHPWLFHWYEKLPLC